MLRMHIEPNNNIIIIINVNAIHHQIKSNKLVKAVFPKAPNAKRSQITRRSIIKKRKNRSIQRQNRLNESSRWIGTERTLNSEISNGIISSCHTENVHAFCGFASERMLFVSSRARRLFGRCPSLDVLRRCFIFTSCLPSRHQSLGGAYNFITSASTRASLSISSYIPTPCGRKVPPSKQCSATTDKLQLVDKKLSPLTYVVIKRRQFPL